MSEDPRIYTIQEFCLRDSNDCPDCGGGLDHYSASFKTQAAARQAIEENLRELMAQEIENLDPNTVEFNITVDESKSSIYDIWRHEAHVGDKFSQWYYMQYEEVPCEWCGQFTALGHIH